MNFEKTCIHERGIEMGNIAGLLIALVVIGIVARYVLKKYQPQAVLFIGGLFLIYCAVLLGKGPILEVKKSTGLIWLDGFEYIKTVFSTRAATLGLIIMVVGGFSRYMDAVGASTALVKTAVKPLQKIGKPYLVMAVTSVLINFLAMFVSSASGFGLLLMVTMFPVLVSLGMSRLSAAAVIATASAVGWGPGGSDNIYAAELAGFDIIHYFFTYQLPVGLATVAALAISHYFVQQYYDKKINIQDEINAMTQNDGLKEKEAKEKTTEIVAPKFYALLPTIPLVLIFIFGIWVKSVKVDIIMATFIALAFTMLLEILRHRNGEKMCKDLHSFFEGMGMQMTGVVTLVVAGETFAKGLTMIGAIDALIQGAQSAGFGGIGMMLVIVLVIVGSTLVMGSGNAPFFAFAPLAPKIAAMSGIHTVLIILPMNFVSNLARSLSPIAAVMMVVSGLAGVAAIDLAKRTMIPIVIATAVNIAMTLILFYR